MKALIPLKGALKITPLTGHKKEYPSRGHIKESRLPGLIIFYRSSQLVDDMIGPLLIV